MNAGDAVLTIGTFARRSRLSPRALRLYDRLGVLSPARVDEHNGYRRYLESQLPTARLIVSLRRLGMPLATVAEVVAARPGARPALLAAYRDEVEKRVAAQRQLFAHLQLRLAGTEGDYTMYQILERDVPEQHVLTEQRHTTVQDLPDWIREATHRLYDAAATLDLKPGASFVIYHGEVNEDSDGPVEVCVPFEDGGRDLTGHAHRVEPAHREAYTRVTTAQVEFPQILSAYEAVERWMSDNGRAAGGPPREVYIADFSTIGPDDDACDIAFPVRVPVAIA